MTTTPWENVTQLMLGVKEGPQIQPLMLGEWFNTQTHGFFSEFSAKNMGLYTVADLHSKILDAPSSVQFSSFSCSLRQILAKYWVGTVMG